MTMTLPAKKDRVNTKLAALWPVLVARQDDYLAAHGRYWQGLLTHGILPIDDDDPLPDQLARTPKEQPGVHVQDWRAMLPELDGKPLPMALQVHTYGAPDGDGWWAEAHILYQGIHRRRMKGAGPLAARFTRGWHKVFDPVL